MSARTNTGDALTEEQAFAVASWHILTEEQRADAVCRLEPIASFSSTKSSHFDAAMRVLRAFAPKPKPEREQVYELLMGFFNGDAGKASAWLEAQNPLLGGMTPVQLLDARPGKLIKIVKQQLAENEP